MAYPPKNSPYPFVPYRPALRDADAIVERSRRLLDDMDGRRSIRMFSDQSVPREALENAVRIASTAPSGAHKQPWTFVLLDGADTKRRIRMAAEEEERTNYEGGRLPEEWRAALEPLGTDWEKPYLEIAPWIVVLFEQRYGLAPDGTRVKHYYVKESVGIAAGFFVAALHQMGLFTLTHTPSPMAFLTKLLGRPENERPFALFPVGFPAPDCVVPDLSRKALDAVMADPPPA